MNQGTLSAKQFIVAVGGRPQIYLTAEQGAEHVITSDDLFSLPESPGKVRNPTLTLISTQIMVQGAHHRGWLHRT